MPDPKPLGPMTGNSCLLNTNTSSHTHCARSRCPIKGPESTCLLFNYYNFPALCRTLLRAHNVLLCTLRPLCRFICLQSTCCLSWADTCFQCSSRDLRARDESPGG